MDFCSDGSYECTGKFEVRSDCSFGLGLPTTNHGEDEAVYGLGGSDMVPFERALVSSYRASIVTFPLSLRVSEIAAFVLQHATFPHPTLVSS